MKIQVNYKRSILQVNPNMTICIKYRHWPCDDSAMIYCQQIGFYGRKNFNSYYIYFTQG